MSIIKALTVLALPESQRTAHKLYSTSTENHYLQQQ